MKFLRPAVAALALVLLATPAPAESVYVTTAAEKVGHAWLFGSRNAASSACWLAVPRHVVESFDGTTLEPIRFKRRSGEWGESGRPVAVAEVPGALEVAGDKDLAFAEVTVGPRPGQCLDRLGLPAFAYEAAIDRRDPLNVFSMLPGSFGDLRVAITAGTSTGTGQLRLAPIAPEDGATFFKQGLSGGVATLARTSGVEPLAMILAVEDTQQTALALRFDRIRAAFDMVEGAILAERRQQQAATSGVPYTIVSFDGLTRGTGPAAALTDPDGCWRVAPEGGKRSVSLVIELADKASTVSGLAVVQSTACGTAPAEIIIDQRVSAKGNWSRAAQCATVAADTGAPACRLDYRAPRQLRINILTRSEIGISGVRLY